jgi:serine protease Do
LTEFGETRRGWLGVGIQEVTDDIASSLGRPNNFGALVVDVTAEGPSAGVLEEGDLILSFNGKAIERMRDLPRIVAETEVGKAVKIKVLRDGAEDEVDITLGRLEVGEQIIAEAEQKADAAVPDAEEPVGPAPSLSDMVGIDIAPLTEELRTQYALPAGGKGVVVTGVKAGTDAEEKGILAGLVISEVNQQPTATVADVTGLVGAAKEDGRPAVLFKVTDPTGASRFIAVKLN